MPRSQNKTRPALADRIIRVLVVEDDPYARDVMALLLTRDWRTRLIAETARDRELPDMLAHTGLGPIDVALVDAERPGDPEWPIRAADNIHAARGPEVVILFTATRSDAGMLRRVLAGRYGGYLLKPEIGYSLAWAVARAVAGGWVTTPGVRDLAHGHKWRLPSQTHTLVGNWQLDRLSGREKQAARLGIVLGLARRDIADDLHLRPDEVGKLMSRIYQKAGLNDLERNPTEAAIMVDDPWLRERLVNSSHPDLPAGKRSDKATRAFHLLTMPDEL